MIVPTLCVGMQPGTLCVPKADAERPVRHSHAEHGNDQLSVSVVINASALEQFLAAFGQVQHTQVLAGLGVALA